MDINSKWTALRAEWDGQNFVNEHEAPLPDKVLSMELSTRPDWEGNLKQVLYFRGGPTGFESYYVEDLLDPETGISARGDVDLCICGGTINSWPRCTVSTADVLKFLSEMIQ